MADDPRLPGLGSALPLTTASASSSPHKSATSSGSSAVVARLASAAMGHISQLCMNPLQANVFLLVQTSSESSSAESEGNAGTATQFTRTDTASSVDSERPSARGPPTRIPAHRAVLAAASPTFAAMFASGMREAADGAEVFVPYSLPVMESVLAFVYCDAERCVAQITADTAMDVLDAACFYQLEALKQAAIDTVVELTSNDTVLPVLAAAVRYGSERLKDHCIGFIRQHNTDVLGSRYWPLLPLDVAVLLVRETVIDSELNLLRSCIAWCRAQQHRSNDNEGAATETPAPIDSQLLGHFLPFINFTAMTMEEMAEVERLGCIPIDVLYKAFKSHALGGAPTWVPRHGGILLQWEYHGSGQLAVDNNHVAKLSQNFDPVTITAMNRFAAGTHYWYFTVVELRTKHDCLIGIRSQRNRTKAAMVTASPTESVSSAPAATACDYDWEIKYEPCCNTVTAIPSSGLRVVRSPECPETVLGPDHGCVIGVCVDFDSAQVRFYDHLTKNLLYYVEAIEEARTTTTAPHHADPSVSDSPASSERLSPPPPAADPIGQLPSPLFPCATLYHRGNGGVVLSDTTTYLGERGVPPAQVRRGDSRAESAMATPKKTGVAASPMSASGSAGRSMRSPRAGPAASPARPTLASMRIAASQQQESSAS